MLSPIMISILLCSLLTFPVDAQEQQCNSSVPYPPNWPQNCVDAYIAHSADVSSFKVWDRIALVQYLNVVCPDCHNSFVDYQIMCGTYDEATGEFWRSTFCLRDDVRDSN